MENDITCIISLEKINIEDLYFPNFCECKYKSHKKCFEKYFELNYKCCICKKYDYNYISHLLIKDYEEIYIMYNKIIKANNIDLIKLNNIRLSDRIIIKVNYRLNKIYLSHYPISILEENDLKNIYDILIKITYKKKIINEIIKFLDTEYAFNLFS